jgi:hypothetical protein
VSCWLPAVAPHVPDLKQGHTGGAAEQEDCQICLGAAGIHVACSLHVLPALKTQLNGVVP